MLVAVDSGYLLDGASSQIPDVEVAATGAEEDARVGRGRVECGCCERRTLHVKRCEERVRIKRGIGVNLVKVECRAGSGGKKEGI